MKSFIAKAALLTCLAGLIGVQQSVAADPRSAVAPDAPPKIGLIDMAQVFKNYKKFSAMRDELKADIEKSEAQAKQMAQTIQKQQASLKELKEGTDEHKKAEGQILANTTKFETYRKTQQRDFIRREAGIYKTVYLEVSDMVKRLARLKSYTLVLRFSADDVNGSENPDEVMRGLNKQVVFYRPSDDVTQAIVNQLNREYDKSGERTAEETGPDRK